MTLQEYWEILRRSWRLIGASTALGMLAAAGFSLIATPVYKAQAQLFVSVQSADEIASAYSGGLYVQQRVKSYVDVVDSPAVLDPVIASLDLDTNPAALATRVSAQTPPNTVLLNVSASDTSAEQAAKITNATAVSFAKEIQRLETTDSGKKPVKATIIKAAQVPGSPVSPRTKLNLVLGALLGLMAGVGVAILRHVMDTTIKSTAELEEASGAITLGAVTFDPDAATHPLVTLRGTPRAEAFRSIRTNLRYVDVDQPPRTVVITSSVPGEGKSTTACNMAIALAQAGSKVLLLEADMRRPKVSHYLDVDGAVGLTDVLIGQIRFDDAIVRWRRGLLDFLPAGAIPPNPSELLGSRQMSDLLEMLKDRYDVILLDCPPLLPVTDAAILATAADGAILVTRCGETKREQVEEAAESLRQVGVRILGTIFNFAPSRRRGGYGYSEYGYGYGYGYQASTSGPESEGMRRHLSAEEVPAPEPRL